MNIHYHLRHRYQWEFAVLLRELKPQLCNLQEVRDGEEGRREVQEGRNIGKPLTDSW